MLNEATLFKLMYIITCYVLLFSVCVFCTVVMLGKNHIFFLCALFISPVHILKKRRPRPTQGCRADDDDDDDILKKVMNCESHLRHFTLCYLASMKYFVECSNHLTIILVCDSWRR